MSPGARLAASLLVFAIAACTASGTDIEPPNATVVDDQGNLRFPLFFPTGAAIAPDESVLFVANANSELRYNGGTIAVFDLQQIDDTANAWTATGSSGAPNCSPDPDRRETLQCNWTLNDQLFSPFIRTDAGVRIGNFATDVAVQDIGSDALRLLIPTRGDPSITWADYTGTGADKKLSCKAGGSSFDSCDDAHILTFVHNDPDLNALPEEPFNVFADGPNGFAVVTHLSNGAVTLVDSPRADAEIKTVQIADIRSGIFAPDTLTGIRGATGVAGRTPGASTDMIYVGSRSEDRIQTFTVGTPPNYLHYVTDEVTGEVSVQGAQKFLLDGPYFFLDAVGTVAGSSTDTRGMAFSPSGNRMYLVNRDPPSLQVFDTSLTGGGVPSNALVAATDICRQASTLAVLDAGDGERAYVTCFQDGQIYVVDPRGAGSVEDIITVGRGPYAVVASAARKKLYVTNFLEDTIAVVDVAPGSTTRNRVVLRIGTPKAP